MFPRVGVYSMRVENAERNEGNALLLVTETLSLQSCAGLLLLPLLYSIVSAGWHFLQHTLRHQAGYFDVESRPVDED